MESHGHKRQTIRPPMLVVVRLHLLLPLTTSPLLSRQIFCWIAEIAPWLKNIPSMSPFGRIQKFKWTRKYHCTIPLLWRIEGVQGLRRWPTLVSHFFYQNYTAFGLLSSLSLLLRLLWHSPLSFTLNSRLVQVESWTRAPLKLSSRWSGDARRVSSCLKCS